MDLKKSFNQADFSSPSVDRDHAPNSPLVIHKGFATWLELRAFPLLRCQI